MAFREVPVFEVREILRLWLGGEGLRSISRLVSLDRKTVRRYVETSVELGLDRDGVEDQLTDVFVGEVVERVRPHRTDGHGEAWRRLDAHRDQLNEWLVNDELTVVKTHELLERQGVVVPQRTLHRYALDELGVGRSARSSTVRVVDGNPGDELQRLLDLTTAHLADASVRVGKTVPAAPFHLVPLHPSMRVRGPALPVRHYGSVDVFLEAIDGAQPGAVLVIDNGGREDEACIGDLVAIEAQGAGLEGMVIWGLRRDTAELIEIGLPIFSLGATPVGPLRLDPREEDVFTTARVGKVVISGGDWVIGDSDGVVFVADQDVETLLDVAESIRDTERRQASEVREGRTLRDQLSFAEYLRKAAEDPGYTLRQHLLEVGGAIET